MYHCVDGCRASADSLKTAQVLKVSICSTSTKEVMFLFWFVCLSVCLFCGITQRRCNTSAVALETVIRFWKWFGLRSWYCYVNVNVNVNLYSASSQKAHLMRSMCRVLIRKTRLQCYVLYWLAAAAETVMCSFFPYFSASSSSRMRVIYHNWSATKQRPHPQSVAEISHHSVLSGDRIRQCETSSGSRHKDTDQCL